MKESTALGAAFLAGLAVGFWSDVQEIQNKTNIERVFQPQRSKDDIERLYKGWQKAVARTREWAKDECEV
jgi:glycerol kinase